MAGVTILSQIALRPQSLAELLSAFSIHSRALLNGLILTGGIVLEAALALALFRRELARRFPAFTTLIAFYALRAALLFALSGRIDADDYAMWFRVLSVTEVVLEAWVALEIALGLMRALGGSAAKRIALPLLVAGCAGALAWSTLRLVEKKDLADNLQVLWWFVMLCLFAALLAAPQRPNLFRIAAGFAGFSLVQLAALAGRNHAVTHHQSDFYVGWSYVPACGFLAVVIYWLATLRRES